MTNEKTVQVLLRNNLAYFLRKVFKTLNHGK